MSNGWEGPLERIDACRVLIPRTYKPGMRTDGIIYADERLLKSIREDRAPEQVAEFIDAEVTPVLDTARNEGLLGRSSEVKV